MATAGRAVINGLNRLHRLAQAGQLGFNVVAENASNRGLKVLLKSYAGQRAGFAEELRDEIRRLGGRVSDRRSVRGIIHRGRITIRAALTIGAHHVERVILSEALIGERTVSRAYQNTLRRDLPPETVTLVRRQAEAIGTAHEQLMLLKGRDGQCLVVRLFDSQEDADDAVEALRKAGFDESEIEGISDVHEDVGIYESQGTTVGETVVSGAVGGALWGLVIGAIAGVGLAIIPEMGMALMGSQIAAWIALAAGVSLVGGLFGAILGFLIGTGVTEEDVYLYDDSIKYGAKLLRLQTAVDRLMEAEKVLHEVNAAARVH